MAQELKISPSLRRVKALAVLAVAFFVAMAWLAIAKKPEYKIPLLILGALPLLAPMAGWANSKRTELTVSGGVVRYRHGVAATTTRAMELRKLQDVRVERSPGQMMWGLGTLVLETAGERGAIVMEDIERAQETADWILEASRGEGKA